MVKTTYYEEINKDGIIAYKDLYVCQSSKVLNAELQNCACLHFIVFQYGFFFTVMSK